MDRDNLTGDYQRTDASLVYEILQRACYSNVAAAPWYISPFDKRSNELIWTWRDIYIRGTDTHGYRDMEDQALYDIAR